MSWTQEIEKRFTDLCVNDAGLSFTQIACKLCDEFPGHTFSRNAVIGKAHRLGISKSIDARTKAANLANRQKSASPRRAVRKQQEQRPRYHPSAQVPKPKPAAARATAIDVPSRKGCFDPLPDGEGVTFDDLKLKHCRWPHGDGESLRYCGKQVEADGASYCPGHAALVYAPTPNLKGAGRERQRERMAA